MSHGVKLKAQVIVVRTNAPFKERVRFAFHRYATLIYFLLHSKILQNYKQSVFGLAWIFFSPLVEVLTWVFLFGYIGKMPSDNLPYVLLVYSGVIVWVTFRRAYLANARVFQENVLIVRSVYISRIVLIVVDSLLVYVESLVYLCLYFVMLLVYQVPFTWAMLLLPLCLFGVVVMGCMIGVLFAYAYVKYKDFTHIVAYGVELIKYISPVAYTSSVIPADVQYWYSLNPLVFVINKFRYLSLSVSIPTDPNATLIGFLVLVLVGLVGFIIYFTKGKLVRDVI